jgi:long-chain acyl-CoA synthetase
MKKKPLRGIRRDQIILDLDLYRVSVPIPGQDGAALSVIDLWPEAVERTILFVHGYAGCAETWEYQINHFAAQFRVVVPDMRGHGQSDAPFSRYTMDEMVADLHAIVEALNLPERFILIGHSFGGAVCVEYANAHPERLDKLVLIATAGEYPLPKITSLVARLPASVFRPFWRYRPRWNAEIHVMKRMLLNNVMQWRGWNLLRNITTPTLVITGERDTFFPPYVFDDVVRLIPHAERYDVGSAKHKVQLERRDAVNRGIERFVLDEGRSSWRGSSNTAGLLSHRPWLAHYGERVPHTIPIPRQPLHRFLESAAGALPNRAATIFFGSTLTYRQLDEYSTRFASALLELGLTKGDRVMLVLPNTPQLVAAYYGVLKMGGVVVLPNPDADAPLILGQLRRTGAQALVTMSHYGPLAQAAQQMGVQNIILADFRDVVTADVYRQMVAKDASLAADGVQLVPNARRMSQLVADAVPDLPLVEVSPDDLAVIAFTSGTTDEPKGVCLTHRNLVANALQTRHWFPDVSYGREVFLTVLPLMHSYGMTGAMNVPVATGSTMVLLPSFDLQQVLEHIRRYKPTLFPGVPSIYTAINHAPDARAFGLGSVKACISGAAPLPVEVQEEFEKLTRGRLVEGYGLTESSPVTHANPLVGLRKVGSIGVPIPNTDARILDLATGEPLAPGQVGELVVRGPQVMQGYWGEDAASESESVLKDGWLYTGDVAVMDEDGYFRIISRKRDTIMMGEYSVYPRDVEEVLYENSKVLEVAVVGVPSAESGQRVKAFVVPRPNVNLSKEELVDLCRRRLDEYAVPWDIEFREELPKSFVGKVLRRLLVDEQQGG